MHWRSSAQGQWSRGPSWSQASMSINRLEWFQQDSPFSGLGLHTGNNSSGGTSRETNNRSPKLTLLCPAFSQSGHCSSTFINWPFPIVTHKLKNRSQHQMLRSSLTEIKGGLQNLSNQNFFPIVFMPHWPLGTSIFEASQLMNKLGGDVRANLVHWSDNNGYMLSRDNQSLTTTFAW